MLSKNIKVMIYVKLTNKKMLSVIKIRSFIVIFFLLSILLTESYSTSVVRLFVFASPDCSHCKLVKSENLNILADKVGCQIEYRTFDISDFGNYQKLVELEKKYRDTNNEMPVVFLGRDVLGGEKEISENLEKLMLKHSKNGGVDWPDEIVNKVISLNEDKTEKITSDIEVKYNKSIVSDKTVKIKKNQIIFPEKKNIIKIATLKDKKHVKKKSVLHITQINKVVISKSLKIINHVVYIAFFSQFGCKECYRVTYLLKYIRQKYPQVQIKEYNLAEKENKVLNEAISIRYGIPSSQRMLPATLYIGSDYLQGDKISTRNIEELVLKYTKTGTECPWLTSNDELNKAQLNISQRFNNLAPLTVAVAGLIDGINPCAFTTLVFLLSYLYYLGKRRKELLIIGGAFTIAVFLTYFAVGLGVLSFLKYLTGYSVLSRSLYYIIALCTIVLGVISVIDAIRAKRGEISDIQLQLPTILKKHIHKTVRISMKITHHALAAFGAGIIISFLELACTGQVYLPTITYMVNQTNSKMVSIFYLALYNIMFIIPLIIVFIIAYKGATSEQLGQWVKKHLVMAKSATALLFLGLGIYLLINANA